MTRSKTRKNKKINCLAIRYNIKDGRADVLTKFRSLLY